MVSHPPTPLPFPKEKRFFFYLVSSSWFPVTCYGQFAFLVCKELCDQNNDYTQGECPVFDRLFLTTDKIDW